MAAVVMDKKAEVRLGANFERNLDNIKVTHSANTRWLDYLLLSLWDGSSVFLLSIKHHRQLFFDLNLLSKR